MVRGYILSKKFTKSEEKKILSAMQKFHKKNEEIENINRGRRESGEKPLKKESGTKLIKELRGKKLSYSEKNMYYDLRKKGATFNAKTPGARARAANWFDNYFEPFRKSKKISSKKAYDIWEKAKTQSYENMTRTELEFALELREMGSG